MGYFGFGYFGVEPAYACSATPLNVIRKSNVLLAFLMYLVFDSAKKLFRVRSGMAEPLSTKTPHHIDERFSQKNVSFQD